MQTFLPFPDFVASARVLDWRRLGKQRSECKQLFRAITESTGWSNHPAARMWRGHLLHLLLYAVDICTEWRARGYNDSLLPWFQCRALDASDSPPPPWLGDPSFHASHRSNLLRKKPEHYAQFGWSESPDLPYVWPKGLVRTNELV